MITLPVFLPGALHWGHPLAFLLFLLLPVPSLLSRWLRSRRRGVRYPNIAAALKLARLPGQKLHHSVSLLRLLALACLIVVLARPQGELRQVEEETAGIDVMLALDLSDSMRANDLQPNRVTAAKRLLEEFIQARPADRIGLAVFAGASFTVAPLTTDHDTLCEALRGLSPAVVAIEGTAIGDGILTATARLLENGERRPEGEVPGRVVILATDGANNRGFDPAQAAATAAAKGVRLYVIGLGSGERVPRLEYDDAGRASQMRDVYGRLVYWGQLDESLLSRLAGLGRGRYFRATTSEELAAILADIDRLEKHKIRSHTRVAYTELYSMPLLLALALLLVERLLARTRFKVLA